VERGEGVFGLTRAFFYAGAQSVLSSLWKIDDRVSAEFMALFYQHLAEGKNKALALRLTKLEMMKSKYKSPFYWAAFILNGDAASGVELKSLN